MVSCLRTNWACLLTSVKDYIDEKDEEQTMMCVDPGEMQDHKDEENPRSQKSNLAKGKYANVTLKSLGAAQKGCQIELEAFTYNEIAGEDQPDKQFKDDGETCHILGFCGATSSRAIASEETKPDRSAYKVGRQTSYDLHELKSRTSKKVGRAEIGSRNRKRVNKSYSPRSHAPKQNSVSDFVDIKVEAKSIEDYPEVQPYVSCLDGFEDSHNSTSTERLGPDSKDPSTISNDMKDWYEADRLVPGSYLRKSLRHKQNSDDSVPARQRYPKRITRRKDLSYDEYLDQRQYPGSRSSLQSPSRDKDLEQKRFTTDVDEFRRQVSLIHFMIVDTADNFLQKKQNCRI